MDGELQATQPMTQHDSVSEEDQNDTNVEMADDCIICSAWGRLIPVAQAGISYELIPKPADGNADADVHTIGRNEACDVVVRDTRVSGYHCRIYRRREGQEFIHHEQLAVYIEDISSNGTFLNNAKLNKREPCTLSSGDELALVSPKKDLARATAYVYIHLMEKCQGYRTRSIVRDAMPSMPSGARSLTITATDLRRRLETDYDVREEVGSGAIGKVYKAMERNTGKLRAVKVVPLRHFALNKSVRVDEMLHEARMLRTICHPGIVSVHDVYCSETTFSLVMQLVEGGDLFDRILKRRFYPESDARGVLRNLLSALSYLHTRSIAHRDIKPENILLRSNRSHVDVLLTDFGLAKATPVGAAGCKTFCGTPQYLAPEVLRQQVDSTNDKGYDGAAADIWSVGVVLFVLLSGAQPDQSDWLFDAIWMGVSESAKNAIKVMTVVEAAERPSAHGVLSLPWFAMGDVARPTREENKLGSVVYEIL